MRLMTWNILDGGAGRIDPLAEVVRFAKADVLIVQEATDEAGLHKLADRLSMDRFLAKHPHNQQGAVAILTRLPLVEAINLTPLDPRLTRAALAATVETPLHARLHLIGLHLHARETFSDEQIRLGELPAILDAARRFAGQPHLLAGDFNTNHPDQPIDPARVRPSAKERIAPQNNQHPREVIRTLLHHGYLDAHAATRTPQQFDTSFTTAHPATRVDFIFLSPELAPALRSCDVFKPSLATYASDHYPVVAELAV
jgi:endonuclease/exonuclease/phosphatase family metal-dependent hydrolase